MGIDILGIDILGIDILGIDILGINILAPTRNGIYPKWLLDEMII